MKYLFSRLARWFKIRMIKTELHNLEYDLTFFAIPFQEYLKEKIILEKKLDTLLNYEWNR